MTENQAFVDSVIEEIIRPGTRRLMESRYFAELREGKLSIRRLQGFALQHYLTNVALLKGFALCMVKYAHDHDLYNHFRHQFNEEQSHPALTKQFGFALGLKEEDFEESTLIFECMAHTSTALRGMLLGSPSENRTWALANESMVCRYSEEFYTYLRKQYDLSERACEFFRVHWVADQDHTRRAGAVVARYAGSPRERRLVREIAQLSIRFKLAKFEGIYQAYS